MSEDYPRTLLELEQRFSRDEACELVIERTRQHLNSNSEYYTERFLQYAGSTTALRTVKQFVRTALSRIGNNPALKANYQQVFDLEQAYLQDNYVFVPLQQGKGLQDVIPFAPWLAQERMGDIEIKPDIATVVLPFDGIHLEATAGWCLLSDVPLEAGSVTLNGEVAIRAGK